MDDSQLEDLIRKISVGNEERPSVRCPGILHDALIYAAMKKFSMSKPHGAISKGLLHFAARGLLDWLEKNDPPAFKKLVQEGKLEAEGASSTKASGDARKEGLKKR